ncbi:hypothetical protein N7532_004448 [Penicillium argentinense]|uniref:Uncharacterized protein n=1 Tax=Penicillium argentinense TaxID=1131581 RepID=A0A9W9KEX4_9EURO|nr:uncharacterized protein N7532_004448 [Penicillium argentinense]KAJ5103919.1 hypothetical protein N7532_004448 [Penicillium argentinense]
MECQKNFATTNQRLVGLISTKDGSALQGYDISLAANERLKLDYHFLGERGFSSIEEFDDTGLIWQRHFWSEAETEPKTRIRVIWGVARLYDRYREAIWNGIISISEDVAVEISVRSVGWNIARKTLFGALMIALLNSQARQAETWTGPMSPSEAVKRPSKIKITGLLGGYVKFGDALAGNSHKA